MKKIPVGAMWEIKISNGASARVWLMERSTIEVWRWSACHLDGSAGVSDSDWATSRRQAVEEAKVALSGMGLLPEKLRFKRIK